jgi:hypothetical protein
MKIDRYAEFLINEAAKAVETSLEILKMLEDKPSVALNNEKWPDEKDLYSQPGIIKFFEGKYSTDQVLAGLHALKNDKKSGLKNLSVKNFFYNESLPYYYVGMNMEEAKDVKDEYENKSEADTKKVTKKQETKTKVVRKSVTKKETTKKEPSTKGAGRKPKA